MTDSEGREEVMLMQTDCWCVVALFDVVVAALALFDVCVLVNRGWDDELVCLPEEEKVSLLGGLLTREEVRLVGSIRLLIGVLGVAEGGGGGTGW